ncbi:MAG: hypothetical protein E4H01_03475 [Lysobacterales bacterium]|nr:MAG: hypothetical protein E4H01_03475 [Xanthomonadales bacterium]
MFDNLNTPWPRPWVGAALTLLLAVLVAAISGCTSSAKFQPTSGSEHLPPFEGQVIVLENLPSSNQFKRVGVVIVEGALLTKVSDMVAALKEKAAESGANAIVMQSPVKVSKNTDGSTHKKLAAWAIRLNR